MSVIDRINERLLCSIRPSENKGVADLIASPDRIRHLFATMTSEFAGDDTTLIGERDDGRLVQITEQHAEWKNLLAAIDRDGRAAMTSTEWQLKLIAQPDQPITLIKPKHNAEFLVTPALSRGPASLTDAG